MNSKQKKISALLQTLTKLGHDRDAEVGNLIKEVARDSLTRNERGLSFRVPKWEAIEPLGILEGLGINKTLLNEYETIPNAEEKDERKFNINEHKKKIEARAIAILNKAKQEKRYGFGGECAETAIAINDVLFGDEGVLVAAANKWLWENEGRMVGHVAVEWSGAYWDAEGKKEWEEIEHWGMLDPEDPDYDFGTEDSELKAERANEVERVAPSNAELIEYFGGCNLPDLIKKLEIIDNDIAKDKTRK
jgi:hypothetical protein